MSKTQENTALQAFKATKLRLRKNVGAFTGRTKPRGTRFRSHDESIGPISASSGIAESADTSTSAVMPLLLTVASEIY